MGLELIGPDPDEARTTARELIALVESEFSGDRWSLSVDSSTTSHRIHAVAGLRHVVALLEGLLDAADTGNEASLRVIARAQIEAWMVAMYVVYFGDGAVGELAAAYKHSIELQDDRLAEADERLRRERRRAKKHNKAIVKGNQRKQQWNEAHPDQLPKSLDDLVAVPQRDYIAADLKAAVEEFEESNQGPPLTAIAGKLTAYGKAHEGPDASVDAVYDIAYRGLSTLGAHPSYWVLQSYVSWRPSDQLIRTVGSMGVPSMADAVIPTATYSTASLAKEVLALRGLDDGSPITALAERWRLEQGVESGGASPGI